MATVIIGVINQKGGVGKTTISVNLAGLLARRNHQVLLIDADPQGSARDWAAARQGASLFPVVGVAKPVLHKEAHQFRGKFDYVLIDGPPRTTDIARSVVAASDIILIPVQPGAYDVWSSRDVVEILQEVRTLKEAIRPYFVLNRKIANTAIARDAKQAIMTSFPEIPIFEAGLSQRVIFSESAALGQTVFEVDKDGLATKELVGVLDELLTLVEGTHGGE